MKIGISYNTPKYIFLELSCRAPQKYAIKLVILQKKLVIIGQNLFQLQYPNLYLYIWYEIRVGGILGGPNVTFSGS